jgi:hypothetical protein
MWQMLILSWGVEKLSLGMIFAQWKEYPMQLKQHCLILSK